jgi:outer membrane murein-binding lipoprotein Lpp
MRYFALGVAVLMSMCLVACVEPSRIDKVEGRLSALEDQSKKAKAETEQRRQQLEQCVKDEANDAYWSVIKLNATYNPKNGNWTGPSYAFDRAERAKRDKIEECKLLYGK